MNTYATRILKKQQKLEKLKADILKKEAMSKAITDEIAKLNSMQYKKWYATLQKEISENIDDLHLDAISPADVVAFLMERSKSYDKANEEPSNNESSNNEKGRKDEGEEDGANKKFKKNTDEHLKVQDENSKQDDTPSIEPTEEKPKKEEAVSQDAGIWTAPESF